MLQEQTTEIRHSRLIRSTPFFYGWIIALVGTLGIIMTGPGQTYAVSIFIEHFIGDLSISRSLVSTLYTVGTLIGSFALPLVGRLIDNRGPRRVMVVVALLFGIACVYMGFVQNAIMLGLGFIAIRMFGQGSLTLVSQNVINRWWVRRRGMVMGLSGVAIALLGVAGIPNLINWLIPKYGWRTTYPILGMLVLGIMAPAAIVFVRSRPEEFGLEPDGTGGDTVSSLDFTPDVDIPEVNWTRDEAMRTPVFWVVAFGVASIAMLSTGLFFHMVSIFADNGLDPTVAATVYIPIAITTAVTNLGSGILIDHIPVKYLLAAALICMATALLMAQALAGVALAFLYGIILGATSGLMRTVNSVVWASYFGRLHLGSITGITFTVVIAGSAIGPMPLGIARDVLGSYNSALVIAAIIPLGLAVASLFFGRPEK